MSFAYCVLIRSVIHERIDNLRRMKSIEMRQILCFFAGQITKKKTLIPRRTIHAKYMKQILVVAGLFMLLGQANGQPPKGGDEQFQKLFDLYAMEKFESCAFKAEGMSAKDKYRRQPEPYLYMAMCFLKIHLFIDDYEPDKYKAPLKDALKYAYKFRKLDKDSSMFNSNLPFIDALKEEANKNASFYYKDKQYRKSATEYNRILKVDPGDDNVRLMTGLVQVLSKNLGEGQKNLDLALTNLKQKNADKSFKAGTVTEPILVDAFIGYSNFLVESGKREEAEVAIQLARELLPRNTAIVRHYNKIYYD